MRNRQDESANEIPVVLGGSTVLWVYVCPERTSYRSFLESAGCGQFWGRAIRIGGGEGVLRGNDGAKELRASGVVVHRRVQSRIV